MNALVQQTTTCTRVVPEPPVNDGSVSRSNISVFADGAPVPRDASHANGWDYIDASLTSIQLLRPGLRCGPRRGGHLDHLYLPPLLRSAIRAQPDRPMISFRA